MDAPLGSLEETSSTEDRTLFAYRPKKRTPRGVAFLAAGLVLVAGALILARPAAGWTGWSVSIVPLFAASALAYCGMLDLLRRPMFHLEIDRRARTLALAMPREQGQALAKVRFDDAASVEIAEKGPPRSWKVTILLRGGRRIGIGFLDETAGTEALASRFSEILGVPVVRI